MKSITLLTIWSITMLACNNSNIEKEQKTKDIPSKTERTYKNIDALLSFESEKIVLLSKIQNINYDTLFLILRDYNYKTSTIIAGPAKYKSDSSRIIHSQAIDFISQKYNLTKRRIATLIFCFKYEMLTREEIEDNAVENLQNEAADQSEQDYDDDPIH